MVGILGHILFGVLFIATPVFLFLFLVIAILEFIDDIRFTKNNNR